MRRWLKRIAIALGVTLGVLALLVGAVLLWLGSDSGQEFVRAKVEQAVDNGMAGDVRIQSLSFGLRGLTLRGLTIAPPGDPAPALKLDEVEIVWRLGPIFGKRVVIDRLHVRGPVVDIAELPDGTTTLSRALAPAKPAEAPPPAQPAEPFTGLKLPVEIDLGDLTVEGVEVTLRPAPGAPPRMTVRDVSVHLSTRVAGPDASLLVLATAKFWQERPGAEPLDLPLGIDLRASLHGGRAEIEKIAVSAGAADVSASGSVAIVEKTGALQIALRVPRSQIDRLAPAAKMAGDVKLWGEVNLDGKNAVVDLTLTTLDAGAGKVTLHAVGGLDGPVRAFRAELKLVAIDGSRWSKLAPPTLVDMGLAASGTAGPGPEDLEVDATLRIDRLELRGVELADGDAALHYSGATQVADLKSFGLSIPGARIDASGRYAPGALRGDLHFNARDLRLLAVSATRALGQPPPPVAGTMDLTAHVEGDVAAFVAKAHLTSPRLVSGKTVVRGLALDADLSGLPKSPAGDVHLTAAGVQAGATALSDVDLSMDLDGLAARVGLDATVILPRRKDAAPDSAAPSGRISMQADGKLSEKRDAISLAAMSLAYPGARWTLEAPTHIAFGGGTVVIDPLALSGDAGRIAVEGRTEPKKLDLEVAIAGLDLARLPAFAMPPRAELSGKVDLDARVAGNPRAPAVDARLALVDGSAFGYAGLGMNATAHMAGGRVKADVTAEQKGVARIAFAADAPIDILKAAPTAPLSARIRVEPVELSRLPLALDCSPADAGSPLDNGGGSLAPPAHLWRRNELPPPPAAGSARTASAACSRDLIGLRGTVAFSLDASGTLADPVLKMVLDAQGVDVPARKIQAARMNTVVDLAGGQLAARIDTGLGAMPLLRMDAVVPLDLLQAIRAPKELAAAMRREPLVVDLTMPGLDLAVLAAQKLAPPGLAGLVTLEAHLRGTADAPTLASKLAARDLVSGKIAGAGADATLDASTGGVRLVMSARLAGVGDVARFDGHIAVTPEELIAQKRQPADLPLDLKLVFPPQKLVALMIAAGEKAPEADGTLSGTMTVKGTPAHPVVESAFAIDDITARGKPVGAATASLTYRADRAASHVELRSTTGGALKLDAATQLALEPFLPGPVKKPAPDEIPLDIAFRADGFDLGFAAGMAPSLKAVSGKLEADVRVKGTAAKPEPAGFLKLENGRVAVRGVGDYEAIFIDLALDNAAAELKRFALKSGKGTVSAHGRAVRGETTTFEAALQTRDFRVAVGDAAATVGFDVEVKGKSEPRLLEAEVRVPHTLIVLPEAPPKTVQSLAPHPEVVLARDLEAQSDSATDTGPATVTRIHLIIPGDFRVKSSLLEMEASADVTAVQEGKELRLDGSAQVIDGWVSALSRRFTFERGRIEFSGGPPKQARIDVKAVHHIAGYKVLVIVTGTGDNRTVSLLSEPPLKEDEIAFLLSTGSPSPKSGAGGDVQLEGAGLSLVGSAVGEVLKSKLADTLPLDVLSVEGADVSNLRLKTGVYVGTKLYLGTQVQPGASEHENLVEGRAEYRVDDNVTLEGTVGQTRSGADVIWSTDF